MIDLRLGDCLEIMRVGNLREIDVIVAREIFGLDVLGRARVCYCDGCCFVAQPSEDESENDFVYLRECKCAEVAEIEKEFITEHPEIEPMEQVKILGHDGMCLEDVPEYSTSIAAAFEIVAKVLPQWEMHISPTLTDTMVVCNPWPFVPEKQICVVAETAPLAICLAAIQRMREGV